MIEIVFDLETTGLEPERGHKVVEIGAVKIRDRREVIEEFHAYVNPRRDMPKESFAIHGISAEFLADKPIFADVAEGFLKFIGTSTLVAHNAKFDIKFLNYELENIGHIPVSASRVVDTLQIARKKFPGSPARLDDLCNRFSVSLETRTKHGALIDSRLLAEVYRHLMQKKETLLFEENKSISGTLERRDRKAVDFPYRKFLADDRDIAAHLAMKKIIENS